VVRLVRALRKGWIKAAGDRQQDTQPEVYLIWEDDGAPRLLPPIHPSTHPSIHLCFNIYCCRKCVLSQKSRSGFNTAHISAMPCQLASSPW
jgi:hypothetical protein